MTRTHIVCIALVPLTIAALTACADVQFDPFGRPYDPKNAMAPRKFKCEPVADTSPELVSGTRPMYPVKQALKGRIADVSVQFRSNVDGTVTPQLPDDGPSSFSKHAALAMSDWVVTPARKNGIAVSSVCTMKFQYSINGYIASERP